MGRRPTKNLNLPRGMRARKKPSGRTYYYLDTGGKPRKEIPLGDDYVTAVQKWAQLTVNMEAPVITFKDVSDRYQREVIPAKAPRTRKDNLSELAKLLEFFNDPPIPFEQIEPINVREYLDWRGATAKVRANRERALLSHIWNFAREKGITKLANPCRGVRGFSETGRKDVYIEDHVYQAVYAAGSQALKDAMDLAYLTGQRPADVLKMTAAHIKNDTVLVRQNKTGAALRVRLKNDDGTMNDLGRLIESISERKRARKVSDIALVCGRGGIRLTASGLDNAFDRARAKAIKKAKEEGKNELSAMIKGFQFRDLRAKAGTDKADNQGLLEAQRQLGHASAKMTEQYVRLGKIVTPTR